VILNRALQLQNHSYNSEQGITTLEQVLQLQERNYVLIALSAGAVRGTGSCPLLHHAGAFSFHFLTKRNSLGPKGERRKSGII
jgi:hypothetical protein